jgi:hypothetical protein
MNLGTQTQTLRNFVLCNLQHTLAVPVLVAILENDLDRLEAINKIIIKMDDEAVESAVIELNQAMRDLGLRRSGFFDRNGEADTMWFGFSPLPHGSFRTSSCRSGTLHIHALNGAGELYVLSPAARRIANPALASEALVLKSAAGSVMQQVDVADALAQIRSVLAAAIAASEALVH